MTVQIPKVRFKMGAPVSFKSALVSPVCCARICRAMHAFKLMMSAQTKWRKLEGANRMPEIIEGFEFKDGIKQLNQAA